jgi:IS6 family transposase
MAVGWYLRFSLSYRDVEELVRERGLSVDHVTIWRWVQPFAPEIDRRLRPHLKPTNKSWRVDETHIRVKGKWTYSYRAVDSTGASIDFLLSARRDAAVLTFALVQGTAPRPTCAEARAQPRQTRRVSRASRPAPSSCRRYLHRRSTRKLACHAGSPIAGPRGAEPGSCDRCAGMRG